MELRIAKGGEWRPGVLGGSAGLSGDILAGREAEITWEDVFGGMSFFFPFFLEEKGGGLGKRVFVLVLERERENLKGECGTWDAERNMDIKRIRANAVRLDVGDETREAVDFHTEMEWRLRMDW